MFPNSPDFEEKDVEAVSFYSGGIYQPRNLPSYIKQNSKLGPSILDSAQGDLNARWWLMTYEDDYLSIRGAAGIHWTQPVAVVGAENLEDFDFTFNAEGVPIVIFIDTSGNSYLDYLNSSTGDRDRISLSSMVTSCAAGYDLKSDSDNTDADAMIAYVREGSLYWRLERDDFSVEYDPDVSHDGLIVEQMGLTSDSRFQITYNFYGSED